MQSQYIVKWSVQIWLLRIYTSTTDDRPVTHYSPQYSGISSSWDPIFDGCTDTQKQFLLVVAGRMLLHNASGFERRILSNLSEFPLKLFLLVRAPANVQCTVRKQVAEEILGTRDRDLEINAQKLKHRFKESLHIAATKGILPHRLFWLLKGATIMMKSDVRENERLNKMQGLMTDRCPSASVELQSSRLQLKYLLGEGGEGAGYASSFRWSKFKPVAEKVRDECLRCWDGMLDVQTNPLRWSPSTKATDCISATRALYLHGLMNPHQNCHSVQHTWAASYNMVAHRALGEVVEENLKNKSVLQSLLPVAICIAVRRKGMKTSSFRFFVSAETVRKKHRLLEVQWNTKTRQISWSELANFKPLLVLIKEHFDTVREGHDVHLMFAELTALGDLTLGVVNCATVGSIKQLVKLEPPFKKFLKKISAVTGSDASEPKENDIKQTEQDDPSSSAVGPQADIQELGLNLLVQEAEIRANSNADNKCDTETDDDERENDHESIGITLINKGPDQDDYQHYVAKGVSSAFHGDPDDDVLLQNFAEQNFKQETNEELVTVHEQSRAFQSLEAKSNLDSNKQQSLIEQVQTTSGLDPVDAALEVGLASAVGVDVVPPCDHVFDEEENGFSFAMR